MASCDLGTPRGVRDRALNPVRTYIERAGYTFPGSCHLFRHAMATHIMIGSAYRRLLVQRRRGRRSPEAANGAEQTAKTCRSQIAPRNG